MNYTYTRWKYFWNINWIYTRKQLKHYSITSIQHKHYARQSKHKRELQISCTEILVGLHLHQYTGVVIRSNNSDEILVSIVTRSVLEDRDGRWEPVRGIASEIINLFLLGQVDLRAESLEIYLAVARSVDCVRIVNRWGKCSVGAVQLARWCWICGISSGRVSNIGGRHCDLRQRALAFVVGNHSCWNNPVAINTCANWLVRGLITTDSNLTDAILSLRNSGMSAIALFEPLSGDGVLSIDTATVTALIIKHIDPSIYDCSISLLCAVASKVCFSIDKGVNAAAADSVSTWEGKLLALS